MHASPSRTSQFARQCLAAVLALSRALASPARRSRSRVRPLPAGAWAPQVRGGEGAEPGPACPRPRLPLRCVCNKIDAGTLVYQLGPATSQGPRNPIPPTGIRPCLLPHYGAEAGRPTHFSADHLTLAHSRRASVGRHGRDDLLIARAVSCSDFRESIAFVVSVLRRLRS